MIEHVVRARVAWVDTDAGGRIHFTAVFRWAELAETALRRELGLMQGERPEPLPEQVRRALTSAA